VSELAPDVARAEEAAYREAIELYVRRLLTALGPDALTRLRGVHRHLSVAVDPAHGGTPLLIVTTFDFGANDAEAAKLVEAAGGRVTEGAPS
jgi:phosphomannomutase